MKLDSATTLCFRPCSLDEALDGIAQAGFPHVELCAVKGFLEHLDPDDLSPAALASVRRGLERSGLSATSLSGHGPWHTVEGQRRHARLLDACVELGIPVLNSAPVGLDSPEELDLIVEPVARLAEAAHDRGVTICLENDGKAMPTATVAAAFLERLDHPAVRLNYDLANSRYFGGADPAEDVRAAMPHLGHVHVKDQRGGLDVIDFPPLGEGDLDLPMLARAIAESGYDGPLCLEIEFDGTWPDRDGCLAAVEASKRHWSMVTGRA